MKTLEKTFSLAAHLIKSNFHFIVIGTGGTGGYLVPNLVRQISIMNANKDTNHKVTLCDRDVVELKNLHRQNFIEADLNQNKAEVLAARYSSSFGTEVSVKPSYIESKDALFEIMDLHAATFPVIIGCVDNNKTRQMIASAFYSDKRRFFWIDSGNEEYAGQVVCGLNDQRTPADNKLFYMPCITDVFPDVMNDKNTKFITEMSCAERAISAPQSIGVNITAGGVLFNFCNNILNSNEVEGLKVNMVTFNTKINSYRTILNTKSQLELRYLQKKLAAG